MRIFVAATFVLMALSGCASQSDLNGDCTGSVSTGPNGEVSASGGCGDCQGSAMAGNGDAGASGSCNGCSGTATAGGAAAGSAGSCMGCSGSANANGGSAGSSGSCVECTASASSGSNQAAASTSGACSPMKTKDVSVYTFAGTVTGASPPNPTGPGGVSSQLPIAKHDTFAVANGTLALAFAADIGAGSGGARIEVHAPDGTLAYASETRFCGGAPGGPVTACNTASGAVTTDMHAEGTYNVDYYIGGAFGISLDVVATVPA
ncbi:MAG: hypothetical protein V4510_00640 [bacterium]